MPNISRRQLLSGVVAASTVGAVGRNAWAATPMEEFITQTNSLIASYKKAASGQLADSLSVVQSDTDATNQFVAALRNLTTVSEASPSDQLTGQLSDRAANLLLDLNRLERSPPDFFSATRAPAPNLGAIRKDYIDKFGAIVVPDNRKKDVEWYASSVVKNRDRYSAVELKTGVPWFFVGILHSLEASFSFKGHLHNGDPLSARTVHVPENRPPTWNPPSDWESSAVDAMEVDKFVHKGNWSDLPTVLYRFERFNGFGYRSRKINSPYLWSYSTYYKCGKFRTDGSFDATLASTQCGAAVTLKRLLDNGTVKL